MEMSTEITLQVVAEHMIWGQDSRFFIYHRQSYTSTTPSDMCPETLLDCAKRQHYIQ